MLGRALVSYLSRHRGRRPPPPHDDTTAAPASPLKKRSRRDYEEGQDHEDEEEEWSMAMEEHMPYRVGVSSRAPTPYSASAFESQLAADAADATSKPASSEERPEAKATADAASVPDRTLHAAAVLPQRMVYGVDGNEEEEIVLRPPVKRHKPVSRSARSIRTIHLQS